MDYEWIVTKQDLSMCCKRCGQTYKPSLPAPVLIYLAICKAFAKGHKDCT